MVRRYLSTSKLAVESRPLVGSYRRINRLNETLSSVGRTNVEKKNLWSRNELTRYTQSSFLPSADAFADGRANKVLRLLL